MCFLEGLLARVMAPLYDSFCTLEYPELSGTMGAQIGAHESSRPDRTLDSITANKRGGARARGGTMSTP
jgi:hypothetical protein